MIVPTLTENCLRFGQSSQVHTRRFAVKETRVDPQRGHFTPCGQRIDTTKSCATCGSGEILDRFHERSRKLLFLVHVLRITNFYVVLSLLLPLQGDWRSRLQTPSPRRGFGERVPAMNHQLPASPILRTRRRGSGTRAWCRSRPGRNAWSSGWCSRWRTCCCRSGSCRSTCRRCCRRRR